MPTPPLLLLEPLDAVQRVRCAFGCTAAEAAAFLHDALVAGTITARVMGPLPPADYDPRDADWFSGEIVIRTKQQTSTIPIGGYNPFEAFDREQRGLPPRKYRYPMRTLTKRYPFKIARRQLDIILARAGAVVKGPNPPMVDLGERKPHLAPRPASDLRHSSSEPNEAGPELQPADVAELPEPAVKPCDHSGASGDGEPEACRDTVALRGEAMKWLAAYITDGKHRDRNSTLKVMRAAHPGLGVRGSFAVWGKYTKQNLHLQLSRPGAKLKRHTNN